MRKMMNNEPLYDFYYSKRMEKIDRMSIDLFFKKTVKNKPYSFCIGHGESIPSWSNDSEFVMTGSLYDVVSEAIHHEH